jgi:hypothetical protein
MWIQDLALGHKYEDEAIKLLGEGKIEQAPRNKKFSDWDFKHNDIAYEVKSDRRAYQTGNLCIEYEHSNVPSGISVTKADYWLYFVIIPDIQIPYRLYKIPTSVLNNVVSNPETRTWYTDNGNSRFYLVPYSLFNDYLIN